MKSNEKILYFIVFESHFKIGITSSLKERLGSIANEVNEEINFNKSFYYVMHEKSTIAIERELKIKYADLLASVESYKTESFQLSYIDIVNEDVKQYHKLFNIPINKETLINKFIGVYDDNGKIRLQKTENLFVAYKHFRGREEYFNDLFGLN